VFDDHTIRAGLVNYTHEFLGGFLTAAVVEYRPSFFEFNPVRLTAVSVKLCGVLFYENNVGVLRVTKARAHPISPLWACAAAPMLLPHQLPPK
jgi:hypothetical protein